MLAGWYINDKQDENKPSLLALGRVTGKSPEPADKNVRAT
jgi:hypothetical protein